RSTNALIDDECHCSSSVFLALWDCWFGSISARVVCSAQRNNPAQDCRRSRSGSYLMNACWKVFRCIPLTRSSAWITSNRASFRVSSSITAISCSSVSFAIYLLLRRFQLLAVPCLKLRYRLSKQRQFNVAVEIVRIFITAMPHQFLTYVLNHPCLDQPGVKGRAQVLKPEWSNTGPANCGFPGSLDPVDWFLFVRENETFG